VEELASHDVHIHIVAGICIIDNISIRDCQIVVKVRCMIETVVKELFQTDFRRCFLACKSHMEQYVPF